MCELKTDQKLREVIIWLAGLLSTDGSVSRQTRPKHAVRYRVISTEKEWLEQIAKKLSGVGIKTSIEPRKRKTCPTDFMPYSPQRPYAYCLNVHEPYRITLLLREYGQGFMMERKWKKVLSVYPDGKKFTHWTQEENDFLIKHYKTMSYAEIGRRLNRSGIHKHVRDLRRRGVLPKDDVRRIRFPSLVQTRQRRQDGTFMRVF